MAVSTTVGSFCRIDLIATLWISFTTFFHRRLHTTSGAVVKNLNSDKVANALFPLPPLSEQVRIVQRIEKLLPLVKGL